jgi:hypothetical protein
MHGSGRAAWPAGPVVMCERDHRTIRGRMSRSRPRDCRNRARLKRRRSAQRSSVRASSASLILRRSAGDVVCRSHHARLELVGSGRDDVDVFENGSSQRQCVRGVFASYGSFADAPGTVFRRRRQRSPRSSPASLPTADGMDRTCRPDEKCEGDANPLRTWRDNLA